MVAQSMTAQRGLDEPRAIATRCSACPIRERAVCAYCSDQELTVLDGIKSYRTFTAGREILAAGETTPFVASIVTGVVKLTKTLPDGRVQIVGLLFPSDFIGKVRDDVASYDAIAATDVTLCVFQRRPFGLLLKNTPALENRLLEMTMDELDAAREWLLVLGRKTARERLASFLLMFARRSKPVDDGGKTDAYTLPLTRTEIAEYLGLTLETVSRQMTKMRGDGIIQFQTTRRFHVPDMDRLQDVADGT